VALPGDGGAGRGRGPACPGTEGQGGAGGPHAIRGSSAVTTSCVWTKLPQLARGQLARTRGWRPT